MQPRSYDPLDYSSLSEVLARELMRSELIPLADVDRFYGDGVYALFYTGSFPAYRELAEVNRARPGSFPIYIGKASPKTLTGSGLDASRVDDPAAGTRLFDRLSRDHRSSIAQASNLDVADFSCRMLVLNALWVPLAESAMIARYAPVWNSLVTGFGNHPPGRGRSLGKLSKWDSLHPGRAPKSSPSASDPGSLAQEAAAAIHERAAILGFLERA